MKEYEKRLCAYDDSGLRGGTDIRINNLFTRLARTGHGIYFFIYLMGLPFFFWLGHLTKKR